MARSVCQATRVEGNVRHSTTRREASRKGKRVSVDKGVLADLKLSAERAAMRAADVESAQAEAQRQLRPESEMRPFKQLRLKPTAEAACGGLRLRLKRPAGV